MGRGREEFGGHHQRGKHTCLGGQLGPAANAFDTFQACVKKALNKRSQSRTIAEVAVVGVSRPPITFG